MPNLVFVVVLGALGAGWYWLDYRYGQQAELKASYARLIQANPEQGYAEQERILEENLRVRLGPEVSQPLLKELAAVGRRKAAFRDGKLPDYEREETERRWSMMLAEATGAQLQKEKDWLCGGGLALLVGLQAITQFLHYRSLKTVKRKLAALSLTGTWQIGNSPVRYLEVIADHLAQLAPERDALRAKNFELARQINKLILQNKLSERKISKLRATGEMEAVKFEPEVAAPINAELFATPFTPVTRPAVQPRFTPVFEQTSEPTPTARRGRMATAQELAKRRDGIFVLIEPQPGELERMQMIQGDTKVDLFYQGMVEILTDNYCAEPSSVAVWKGKIIWFIQGGSELEYLEGLVDLLEHEIKNFQWSEGAKALTSVRLSIDVKETLEEIV
ncbi:MAG: hypothetical protein SNJ49_14935 [Chloracidobacterium sp.]